MVYPLNGHSSWTNRARCWLTSLMRPTTLTTTPSTTRHIVRTYLLGPGSSTVICFIESRLIICKSVSQCICIRHRNRVEMSRRCRTVENRCVFSARVKAFCDSSGACSAGGRLFQVVGPLTAKHCCPTAVRTYGTSRVLLDAGHEFCLLWD